MRIKIIALLLLISSISLGQISVIPALPTDADQVVVTFDATLASNQSLLNYTGDLYVHTGVKVEGNTQWQYVKGTWGNNTTQPKLTRTGANTYTLTISPSIRQYYGVPTGTKITNLCFVFRSSDATKQSEDIFYNVYEQGLSLSITNPTQTKPIYNFNETIAVSVQSNSSTNLKLLVDGVEVQSTSQTSINYSYTASNYGKHWFKAIATNGTDTKIDSVYILVRSDVETAELPAGMKPGVNLIDNQTATIVLNDPLALKNFVYLIGDFSNWLPDEQYYMKRTPDGKFFWITLNNLSNDTEYAFQFLIDGYLRIADPYTTKTLDPNDTYIPSTTYPGLKAYPSGKTNGIASVFSTTPDTYNWQTSNFTPPAKNKLVIYELHIRDFVSDSYIQTVLDSLSYLKKLGVNAIELMPINEFEGNDSWGYNPSFYFAPDKAYGKPSDYKAFIDEAHRLGMAVIIDMVFNHSYGQSPLVQMYSTSDGTSLGTPTSNNPWYNTTCPHPPYCWGYDFNHESLHTKSFMDSVVTYWLTEYKVDGFRFDFTKGFTNTPNAGSAFDLPRINNLKRLADKIWTTNSNAYVILEHFCDNSEEKALSDYGMLIWGNVTYNYGEASMGWLTNSNFSSVSAKQRGWPNPHLVGYMESHDEERMMYKNITYGNSTNSSHDIKNITIACKRVELAANFFIPIPGPKMIWQFGELGYDYSIDHNGRVGKKPIRWDYYLPDDRRGIFNTFAHLNRLKQEYEVFSTNNYDYSLTGAKKWIKLDGVDMDVVILGNFDINQTDFTIEFPTTGKWYEYYTKDSINLTTTSATFTMAPAEYRLYTSKKIVRDDIYVGIDGIESSPKMLELKLWPNPSNGSFNIEINLNKPSAVQIDVFNLFGQKVYSNTKQLMAGTYAEPIELSSRFTNGVYLIMLQTNEQTLKGKLSLFR